MTVKANGIDVSKYRTNINFAKVKAAGIDFVIILAGYGMKNDCGFSAGTETAVNKFR